MRLWHSIFSGWHRIQPDKAPFEEIGQSGKKELRLVMAPAGLDPCAAGNPIWQDEYYENHRADEMNGPLSLLDGIEGQDLQFLAFCLFIPSVKMLAAEKAPYPLPGCAIDFMRELSDGKARSSPVAHEVFRTWATSTLWAISFDAPAQDAASRRELENTAGLCLAWIYVMACEGYPFAMMALGKWLQLQGSGIARQMQLKGTMLNQARVFSEGSGNWKFISAASEKKPFITEGLEDEAGAAGDRWIQKAKSGNKPEDLPSDANSGMQVPVSLRRGGNPAAASGLSPGRKAAPVSEISPQEAWPKPSQAPEGEGYSLDAETSAEMDRFAEPLFIEDVREEDTNREQEPAPSFGQHLNAKPHPISNHYEAPASGSENLPEQSVLDFTVKLDISVIYDLFFSMRLLEASKVLLFSNSNVRMRPPHETRKLLSSFDKPSKGVKSQDDANIYNWCEEALKWAAEKEGERLAGFNDGLSWSEIQAAGLCMMWLYLLACLGHPKSMASIGEMLIACGNEKASDLRFYGYTLHMDVIRKISVGEECITGVAEASGLEENFPENVIRSGLGWIHLSTFVASGGYAPALELDLKTDDFASLTSSDATRQWAKNGSVIPDVEDDPVEDVKPPPVPPSRFGQMQPLSEVGDCDSEDGEKLKKRFVILLSPMPLSGDLVDPDEVYATLRKQFPWMDQANQEAATIAQLSRRYGVAPRLAEPLLLAGPPGSGKSRWARICAEVLGLPFAYLSMAGSVTGVSLMGIERGWRGARASFPANKMLSLKSPNPLLLLDEIGRSPAGKHNGSINDALLPMIEPETAAHYEDELLMGALNLGRVSWVMTTNALSDLPSALMDRVRLIQVPSPGPEHFDMLFEAIRLGEGKRLGIPVDDIPGMAQDREAVRRAFADTRSARTIRMQVSSALRKGTWQPPGPREVMQSPAVATTPSREGVLRLWPDQSP